MQIEEVVAREAIRDTLAGYTAASDNADYEALSLSFTEEGILSLQGRADLVGRSAIAEALSALAQNRGHGKGTTSFQRHFLGSSLIEFEGGEARVLTYFQALTEIGPDHAGRYSDRFRKIGDQWLIARREISIDWLNPASRVAAANKQAILY